MTEFRGRDDECVTYANTHAEGETDKGLWCVFDKKYSKQNIAEKHFIPQSQIHDDSEVSKVGDRGKLVIPLWLAESKKLKT